MIAALLALASSVIWGTGDFIGGTATRRMPVLVVVTVSQACGLAAAGIAAGVTRAFDGNWDFVPWAVLAGLVGASALLLFYQALATGVMGVVAPIAALGVVVPVFAGLVGGDWPSAVTLTGIGIAVVGVVTVSGPSRGSGTGQARSIWFALGAAVGFGVALWAIAKAAESSVLPTLVGMRLTSVPLLVLVLLSGHRRAARAAPARVAGAPGAEADPGEAGLQDPPPAPDRASRGFWAWVAVGGICDAGANLLFAEASTRGNLAVVGVLGSLYPAATVLLARAVHGERLRRIQLAGVGASLVGIALIAAG